MGPRPAHGRELRAEAALAEEGAAGCHPTVTVCADCRGGHKLAIYETAMLAHEPPHITRSVVLNRHHSHGSQSAIVLAQFW